MMLLLFTVIVLAIAVVVLMASTGILKLTPKEWGGILFLLAFAQGILLYLSPLTNPTKLIFGIPIVLIMGGIGLIIFLME